MFVYPASKPRKEITTQKGLRRLPCQKAIFFSNTVKNILNLQLLFP